MCTFQAQRTCFLLAHQAESAEVGVPLAKAVPLPSLVLPGLVAAKQAGLENDATAA